MNNHTKNIIILTLILSLLTGLTISAEDIVRPEEIKSYRIVYYDKETYENLADAWKAYNKAYPSEYAYANWMYASRYAGAENYQDLLEAGLKKYPSNPTILYLKAMLAPGGHNDFESLKYLEKAASLDDTYTDPLFALVINYMDLKEPEKRDLMLRKILESGVVSDMMMDYNYNTLLSCKKNAIIITNGDNDTFPAWILTRILKIRPDISIVNRSLLNTEWYPIYLVENGLPAFISSAHLEKLRNEIVKKDTYAATVTTPSGPFGDTLIKMLVDAAETAERPVYFVKTLYITDGLKDLDQNSKDFGLVKLVSKFNGDYEEELKDLYNIWLHKFNTGGLSSWKLKYAKPENAEMMTLPNYAFGIVANQQFLMNSGQTLKKDLFNWYKEYINDYLNDDLKYNCARVWSCIGNDITEIKSWCQKQGIECK